MLMQGSCGDADPVVASTPSIESVPSPLAVEGCWDCGIITSASTHASTRQTPRDRVSVFPGHQVVAKERGRRTDDGAVTHGLLVQHIQWRG